MNISYTIILYSVQGASDPGGSIVFCMRKPGLVCRREGLALKLGSSCSWGISKYGGIPDWGTVTSVLVSQTTRVCFCEIIILY